MGSYGTNGELDADKLVSNFSKISGYGGVTETAGTRFPMTVTVDGKSFTISDTGVVGKPLPTISKNNLKVTTVADKETEITTTSTNKPQSGTPLELSFDVSISEGTITGADKGTLTNGKVTYDTNGTETEVTFTFTLSGVDNSIPNTVTINLGSYYKVPQPGEPETPSVANMQYVTWTLSNGTYSEVLSATEPQEWYNYDNGQWANIKTTNNGLEAYWVWIPRFEYVVPTSEDATQIEVKLITTAITTPDSGYTIHPAFTFNGNPIDGIWVAKFEANSSSPSTSYGGGDSNSLKVQVKPGIQSWRNISTNNIFTVCRSMTQTGGALAGSTNIDSHMMKNIEWGAVAILSQSKYGVFNPQSANSGKIWNNPYGYNTGATILTGYAGSEADASTTFNSSSAPASSAVSEYNKGNGPKASTTGTVYGVYDMAGGSSEYVAGCLNGQENSKFGVITANSTYVDLYTNTANSYTNYDGAKVGDATAETKSWNGDYAYFVYSGYPVFSRGGNYYDGATAGVFAFSSHDGYAYGSYSFRPVFVGL